MSTGSKGTKTMDFWRWRQRDAPTGAFGRTTFPPLPLHGDGDPEGLPLDVAIDDDDAGPPPEFADTTPEIGHHDGN